jgi:hypothetical protein
LQPRTKICQIKQSVTNTDLAVHTVYSCQRINPYPANVEYRVSS